MDQERDRIQADLRGLLKGEVRCDDVGVQMYASDASIYELRPLGVVRPRGVADVVACVQYARAHDIPLHPRGAGSGLAGESLGPGLVLDFSHSMRRVIEIGEETVRVQPGVVLDSLNRALASRGRVFGPDPATSSVTTLGGMLGVDASGSRWLKYGSARRYVEGLQVVLADGSVVEAGRHPLPSDDLAPEGPPANGPGTASDRCTELVRTLGGLLTREAETIATAQTRALVNRSGYALAGALADGQLDLARLLVGSEGTLALITEATLRTSPLPRHSGAALLMFERLEYAARAALEIPRMGASACDLMDRRLLSLARESDVRYDLLLPAAAEAILLVERQGDDADQVRSGLQQIVQYLRRRKRLAFDARVALDADDRQLYWRLARHVVPMLYRLKGSERPLPFMEDIAVPPDVLPDFLLTLQNVLKKHQVTASLFAHAGHGQLHVRPFLDLALSDHVRRMQLLAREVYEEVLQVGGTISGQHGDGLSRSWFVRDQYGPLYDVFLEVKRTFDPRNILNPGKVVGQPAPPLTQNLRPVTVGQAREPGGEAGAAPGGEAGAASGELRADPLLPQLTWSTSEVALAARACNGCGLCRTLESDTRMCPIFRFAPREEAAPRAKANLMRAILTGRLAPQELTGDTLKQVADLCVNCHQCRLECPAHVDIPKLMVEAKAQYVSINGLRPADWMLTRLDLLSTWASLVAPLAHWALANRQMRWLLEKSLGIAQGRKLPRVARRSFLRRAARRRLTRPTRRSGRKVLYFVDIYANWYDVQLAEALVAVLEHNGVAVYVPPRQLQAGMTMISMGAVDRARQLAARNVTLLADAVRQGYHVVATEPAAALCLTHEYGNLLDDVDVRLVAEHTSEACAYLWRLHQEGSLELDFRPVNATVGYHLPCHVKALRVGTPGEHLLGLLPGLKLRRIDRGCSGMAGTYGLKRENYRSSLRAGWGLISALRQHELQLGATECSACKMQMEQGTAKPTLHPLKLLAFSYGLMPEVASLLTGFSEELVVT